MGDNDDRIITSDTLPPDLADGPAPGTLLMFDGQRWTIEHPRLVALLAVADAARRQRGGEQNANRSLVWEAQRARDMALDALDALDAAERGQ